MSENWVYLMCFLVFNLECDIESTDSIELVSLDKVDFMQSRDISVELPFYNGVQLNSTIQYGACIISSLTKL